MKKMKSVRCAIGLAIATLLTTCLIGGTFAKYTTGAEARDSARVAYWGFDSTNTITLDNLFRSEYTNVASEDGADVIAPGTEGQVSFGFPFTGSGSSSAPEVAYTFTVDVTGTCDPVIENNADILFKLDNGSYGTWDQLIAGLKALSGNAAGSKNYAAGELPDAFDLEGETHTIAWRWAFTDSEDVEGQDEIDTSMGNADVLPTCSLAISVTAVQID
ncbi:MAG: hypothetical protein IK088_00590 [Lachnospiraceae bacterium]|nr:hypothetical protein [Lachnospiraceae bacterium]